MATHSVLTMEIQINLKIKQQILKTKITVCPYSINKNNYRTIKDKDETFKNLT